MVTGNAIQRQYLPAVKIPSELPSGNDKRKKHPKKNNNFFSFSTWVKAMDMAVSKINPVMVNKKVK
jgi:hypothetical protein